MSNYPQYFLACPIANDGDKTIPPQTSQSAGTGRLSQEKGWTEVNAQPIAEGGIPPQREDFNGALFLLSQLLFWIQQGGLMNYAAQFDYEAGNEILYNGKKYRCLQPNGPSSSLITPGSNPEYWNLVDLDAVLYTAQSLNSSQQSQARNNIGAAPLASPNFTGTPTVPTPSASDDSTRIPNTAWVKDLIGQSKPSAYIVNSSRSGNSWWREWSDGFIEQHGICGNSGTFNFVRNFTNVSSICLQGTPTSGGHPDDSYCVLNPISTRQFTVSAWRFGNVSWYACGW